MPISLQRVKALLQKHDEDKAPYIVIGDFAETSLEAGVFSFGDFIDKVPSELRRPLGVCLEPGAHNTHVIARLRDIHCERVIVFQSDNALSASDLLALGFQKLAAERDCTIFLYSAEITDRPREWNNSKHWAHPQNFDKNQS